MVAIIGMGMVVHPARAVIAEMRPYNCGYGKRQQPILLIMPYLLGHQEQNAGRKQEKRGKTMVMFPVSMPQRVGADSESQPYHEIFKCFVVYDIHSQDR